MKKNMFAMIVIVAIASLVVSCQKDIEKSAPDIQEPLSMSEDSLDNCCSIIDDSYQYPVLKSSKSDNPPYSSWIMNVNSLKDIPSQYFGLNWKYQSAYKHLKQPDSKSCSWTSYVLTLGTIINAKWGSYPITSDKVYEVKAKCKNKNRITDLETYAKNNHAQYVQTYLPGIGTNMTLAIKQMLNHLLVNKSPFIAIYSCHKIDGSLVGHFVVIHAIDWRKGGRGSTIYYTDPAKKPSSNYQNNLYSADLYDFFDGMLVPDQVRNYNFLFLVPNRY